MKTVAIIQARMGSSRLPGKVLRLIGNKPLLWYVCKGVAKSKLVDKIVVATSTDKTDNPIAEFCGRTKIRCFRGDLDNVLGRYFQAALKEKADVIVRITGDCPLIDGKLIDQGLKLFEKFKLDYLSNTLVRTFPRGFDFEIFTFRVLKKAQQDSKKEYEREHVTPFIWENKNKEFNLKNLAFKENKSGLRLTVDEESDFELVRTLIEDYNLENEGWLRITNFLESHPKISGINKDVEQKPHNV